MQLATDAQPPQPVSYASPSTPRAAWSPPRWLVGALLTLIVAIALAARLYDAGRLSLHYDEAWFQELATGRGPAQGELKAGRIYHGAEDLTSLKNAPPWWHIWTHPAGVTHPPLYPIVLRCWRTFFGDGDVFGRALSAILSAAAVLLLFDAVHTKHGKTAGLWAAAIMALASAQVELAQEIRPYSLLILFGTGALAALARMEVHGPTRRRTVALAGCVLGMMLTHYYAAGAVAAIFAYHVIAFRGRTWRSPMTAVTIALVLFAIIWGPMLLRQREAFADADGAMREPPSARHVLYTLDRLARLPLRLLFEPREEVALAGYGGAVLLLSPLLIRKRRDLALWVLFAAGTIGLVAAVDLALSTWQLELIRYTLLAGPALYALLAVLAPPTRPVARQALAAFVVLGCALALPGAYTRPQADYRQLAQHLERHVKPGEVVVFSRSPNAAWYGRTLYLGVEHYAAASREWPFVILETPPDEKLSRQLAAAPGVWLVSGVGGIEPDQLFPGGNARRDESILFQWLATCEHIRGADATTKP